jgi:hypothetical protein
VHEGDVPVEIDRTINTTERDRLDIARQTAFRAVFATTRGDFTPPPAGRLRSACPGESGPYLIPSW